MNFLDNLVDIRTKELDLDNKEKLARAHFLSLGFVKAEDNDEYKYINEKFGVKFWIYIDDVEISLVARYRNKCGNWDIPKSCNNFSKNHGCILETVIHSYSSEQVEQILKEIIEKCEYGRKELVS